MGDVLAVSVQSTLLKLHSTARPLPAEQHWPVLEFLAAQRRSSLQLGIAEERHAASQGVCSRATSLHRL